MNQLPSKAVAFTAYNRVGYLARVLNSWKTVRGLDDWFFYFSVDPSPRSDAIVNLFTQFAHDMGLSKYQIVVNDRKKGVLHHPWVVFDHLFSNGFDFVVRVEDDLLVSDDFLEYMEWSRTEFRDEKDIAAVVGYISDVNGGTNEVIIRPKFSPWNWGIWKDRWETYIRDTWDHDYSTFNGRPGLQSGWDWNLDTRVLPSLGKSCVYPAHSRVQNIGQMGTHAIPQNFPQSTSFREVFGEKKYLLGR